MKLIISTNLSDMTQNFEFSFMARRTEIQCIKQMRNTLEDSMEGQSVV